MSLSDRHVIIMGGGVGGLSAAHELLEQGFEVTLYDRLAVPGGKARSYPVEGIGYTQGDVTGYPAEHGFRFFPGFYRHITDVMSRIPDFNGGKVIDHMVETHHMGLFRQEGRPFFLKMGFPFSIGKIQDYLQTLVNRGDLPDISVDDLTHYSRCIWQIATSSHARREHEYERIAWWDFIDASNRSRDYQLYLANLTRTLVAANPKRASAKTNGDILLQMVLDMWRSDQAVDRVLDGPTNEVWIHPWVEHLCQTGRFHYYLNAEVCEIYMYQGQVSSILVDRFKEDQPILKVTGADRNGYHGKPVVDIDRLPTMAPHFISALPVERFWELIENNDAVLRADPTLCTLKQLQTSTAWMNGLQFYLRRDVSLTDGHLIFVDAPWALTAISQAQFWKSTRLQDYGNGELRGILSVDISSWLEEDGVIHQCKAYQCTPAQVVEEVWEAVKKSLANSDEPIGDDDLIGVCLDRSIQALLLGEEAKGPEDDQAKVRNQEPLLINRVNTWTLRPEAYTRIPNLFLASDYVRTYTDLATMEAANEAARRAVNAILMTYNRCYVCRWWPINYVARALGVFTPVKIWDLSEPKLLGLVRRYDRWRYERGLPWRDQLPWAFRLGMKLLEWLVQSRGLFLRLSGKRHHD